MRASKTVGSKNSGVRGRESHISGAEGLYEFPEIESVVREYLFRAMDHPKGRPEKVVITLEEVKEKPLEVCVLPFSTVKCDSPDTAAGVVKELLSVAGVSQRAIRTGMKVVAARFAMSGAALILSRSAYRAEPDRERGIRVSRLGITRDTEKSLSRRLARKGIDTTTVKEAIILASKVASCREVMAELCVSDDPDYTTGYVAAGRFGYIRVPNIKRKGSVRGGRVFFVDEDADVERIVRYLERTPVMVVM